MTRVWPALWPPWKRTTMSARSQSQSTILPLPSSPHWAPITTTFAISASPFRAILHGPAITYSRGEDRATAVSERLIPRRLQRPLEHRSRLGFLWSSPLLEAGNGLLAHSRSLGRRVDAGRRRHAHLSDGDAGRQVRAPRGLGGRRQGRQVT